MKFTKMIAAITLVAMMTASPMVSLAEELMPEPNAAIEQEWTLDAEEAFGLADEVDEADALEEIEEAEEAVELEEDAEVDVEAADEEEEADEEEVAEEALDEDGEEAAVEAEAEETEEAEESAGLDLMAAFSEEEQAEFAEDEAGESDKAALAQQLIDEAMDAAQDQGIAAAMDDALDALAENAAALRDEETGALAVTGDEIINITANAAQARFGGLTSEEVYGAVSAATLRANAGEVRAAMSGSGMLTSMIDDEKVYEAMVDGFKKATKKSLENSIDALGTLCPGFKSFVIPMLKTFAGDMFDNLFPSPENKVMKKLNEIEQQINSVEASIKNHTDNVVILAALGGLYGTVRDTTQTLASRVDDICFNPRLTEGEKMEKLADLRYTDAVTNLETALNGATNAFNGDTEYSLERKSIFDMAFASAAEKCMFSCEAIEAAAPYLMRQLATYMAGYTTLCSVYDAYEYTYGASSMIGTRETMAARLGGVDRNGNEMGGSVAQKYEEFFGMDKFTFINQGKTAPVKLSPKLKTRKVGACADWQLEDMMRACPLTKSQVESLAKFCKDKGVSLYDYLCRDIGFVRYKETFLIQNYIWVPDGNACENAYLVAGGQEFDLYIKRVQKTTYTTVNYYRYRADVVRMDKKGAGVEDHKLVYERHNGEKDWENWTMIAFQKG